MTFLSLIILQSVDLSLLEAGQLLACRALYRIGRADVDAGLLAEKAMMSVCTFKSRELKSLHTFVAQSGATPVYSLHFLYIYFDVCR